MPVLVDDMISTGNTMVSAIEALVKMGCQTPVTIVASHGLIVGQAHRNLAAVPVNKIILTDSCPQICESELPIDCVNISELLAATIKHIHAER
jgi:ribose-phosphate pyrophosphokinase